MTAKVDKVFSDAEKLPEHSHDGIPSAKLQNTTKPASVKNVTKNSTVTPVKPNVTKPVLISQKKSSFVPVVS